MFEALSKKRKSPTEKDIDVAIDRIMKEKNIVKGKNINTDKYLH